MNTKQLLQSVTCNTSGLSQAESVMGTETLPDGVADEINAFLQNEEAVGPGSYALAQQRLNAIVAKIPD